MTANFERLMLKQTLAEAKAIGATVKDAWVIKSDRQWEFHYQSFYWHGRAENAWDAREKGWTAWIRNNS